MEEQTLRAVTFPHPPPHLPLTPPPPCTAAYIVTWLTQLNAVRSQDMPDDSCSSRALELVDLLDSALKMMPSREVGTEAVPGFAAGLNFSSKVQDALLTCYCRCRYIMQSRHLIVYSFLCIASAAYHGVVAAGFHISRRLCGEGDGFGTGRGGRRCHRDAARFL